MLSNINLSIRYFSSFSSSFPSLSQKKIIVVALLIISALGAIFALCYYALRISSSRLRVLEEEEDLTVEEQIKKILEQIIPLDEKVNQLELEYQKKKNSLFLFSSMLIDPARLKQYANHMIFQNCSYLEEANIILLGEVHSIDRHTSLEMFIVTQFGKPGDVVLFEGHGEELNSNLNKFVLRGWDNMDIFKKQLKVVKEVYDIEKRKPHFEQSDLEELELENLWNLIELYHEQRNQVLIESIATYRLKYPSSKIFVLAGSGHLKLDEYNILDLLPKKDKYALITFDGTEEERMGSTHYAERLLRKQNML